MHIKEARTLVGQTVMLTWHDRKGDEIREETFVYKADFVPMYGPCLFTDFGEIHVDRILTSEPIQIAKAS